MSPITMALLGLLAYKAVKGFSGTPRATGDGACRLRAAAPSAVWAISSRACGGGNGRLPARAASAGS